MSKHTPGPWKTVSVYADTEVRTDSEALVAVVTPVRCESAENARLISAAPELLAALELARDALLIWAPKDIRMEQITVAIAKARGELFNTGVER